MADPAAPASKSRARSLRGAPRSSRVLAPVLAALALLALAIAVAGCGSSAPAAPAGQTISGPGLQTGPPPWPPEYAHMAERVAPLHLPPVGGEKFHIHAQLHIYKEGILVPVPAEVGLEPAKGIETSMHTHDATGIIHMEASHRFNFTLGDFFTVWGVKLGPDQVGGLTGLGGNKLHFYLNGQPLSDPAALVLHKGDNVAIGYGADSSFPHSPGTQLLREVNEGKAGLNCSSSTNSKKGHGCLAAPGTQPKK
jgi:hypothetical protein